MVEKTTQSIVLPSRKTTAANAWISVVPPTPRPAYVHRDADAGAACPTGAATHLRILATDGRGDVIRERRGDNVALEVTRSFDQKTGRLKHLCSGNVVNCSLQRDDYEWDVAGNMLWRDKAGQYREDFLYDAAHRLTTATYTRLLSQTVNQTHLRLDYDKLGNLCRKTSGGTPVDYR